MFESSLRVKLDVLLELLLTDRAQLLDTASALLISAIDAIHEALVVNAMTQAELVSNLVAHDVAAKH